MSNHGFRAYALSRWLEWTTREGKPFAFKMPSRVHGVLSDRLAGLVRDGASVGRFRVSAADAIAAMRLAIALVLSHGGDMRTFCLCRRGLSTIANLGLSEWECRRGREILEAVGFVERETSFVTWQQWNPAAEPFDRSKARRKATVFGFGRAFLAALHFAARTVRLRFSRIQGKEISSTEKGRANLSAGSESHLGEREGELTLRLRPRWQSDPTRPPLLPLKMPRNRTGSVKEGDPWSGQCQGLTSG